MKKAKALAIAWSDENLADSQEAIPAYQAGFQAAKELALDIWDTKGTGSLGEPAGHVYCDFFYDGRRLLERMGE